MAQKILQIDSSIFGNNGNSASLSEYAIEQFNKHSENTFSITQRNVAVGDLPHFSAETIAAIGNSEANVADLLIEEVKAADILIIGAPMYNFGIPSQLKSWFDHIARAGVTFRYTENGPEGLLTNKQAIVLHTYGGKHAGTTRDTTVTYLDTMFGFLGITKVQHIIAEGLAMEGLKDEVITQAQAAIDDAVAKIIATTA